MVRYWPEKGKSGFLVWRYLLRRDDEEPGPWTKEGKERTKKLGLTMQVGSDAGCLLGVAMLDVGCGGAAMLGVEPQLVPAPGPAVAVSPVFFLWA